MLNVLYLLAVPERSWMSLLPVKTEPGEITPGSSSRIFPPTSLNLSLRRPGLVPLAIPSTSKSTPNQSIVSTPDLDSPLYSSDLSDMTLSPVGSGALNTDILRQELRNKIYARRKSQGLEELTVEFKAPEKTEVGTCNPFYQSPFILTALLHIDLINIAYLTVCGFIRLSFVVLFE